MLLQVAFRALLALVICIIIIIMITFILIIIEFLGLFCRYKIKMLTNIIKLSV